MLEKKINNFLFDCKELESIKDNIVGITPFILSAGRDEIFQFQSFSILFKATVKPSVEKKIIEFMESYPKGVNMTIDELDAEGNKILHWKISGARINNVNFGGFDKNSISNKIITITLQARDIEMEY